MGAMKVGEAGTTAAAGRASRSACADARRRVLAYAARPSAPNPEIGAGGGFRALKPVSCRLLVTVTVTSQPYCVSQTLEALVDLVGVIRPEARVDLQCMLKVWRELSAGSFRRSLRNHTESHPCAAARKQCTSSGLRSLVRVEAEAMNLAAASPFFRAPSEMPHHSKS